MIDTAKLDRILRAAVQAPSGDNSQPWSFRLRDDEIDILIHPERDHAILNVESRGTLLSLGALLENLEVSAHHEGFLIEVSLPFDSHAAAVVRFSQRSGSGHPLLDAVHGRHTNRGAYRTDISDELLQRLSAVHVDGARISVIHSKDAIRSIASSVSVMEESALRTKPLHELFFKSILWDAHNNGAGEPGLYIKTTELPSPVQTLFRLITYWPAMCLLNAIGFAKLAASSNAAIYASSGAIAAVIIDRTESRDYVAAGRAFERLWLEVTQAGLAGQPLAGLLYLAEYLRHGSALPLQPELHKKIIDARNSIYEAFKCDHGTIAMLLRIGEPLKPATARSKRKPPTILPV